MVRRELWMSENVFWSFFIHQMAFLMLIELIEDSLYVFRCVGIDAQLCF